jgi:DNA polymerase III alpha subunit
MIDDFIDRKHGRKQVTYDFPELKEMLEEPTASSSIRSR